MARVSLIDTHNAPDHLKDDIETNYAANDALFGARASSINSLKLISHVPLVARWLAPLIAAMQRNGAGSILPAKLKTLVDIKTSTINDCFY
jgi:hypothetical protein